MVTFDALWNLALLHLFQGYNMSYILGIIALALLVLATIEFINWRRWRYY